MAWAGDSRFAAHHQIGLIVDQFPQPLAQDRMVIHDEHSETFA